MIIRITLGYSQDYLHFGFGGSDFDFDDSTEYEHVLIDTNNIWQITHPHKNILFLQDLPSINDQYGIITDTGNYYQLGVTSSFQFKLLFLSGTDIYHISFWQKYDFNPNVDGGIIETSWDYGATWHNIIFDSCILANLANGSENMYNLTDTISAFNNQPGFTGLQATGTYVNINFMASQNFINDTLLLRFTFKSDSINSSHEGWLLDNFSFGGTVVDGVSVIKHERQLKISPNPVRGQLTLRLEDEAIKVVELLSLTGMKIKEYHDKNTIDVSGIASGIYLLMVNHRLTEKLIIE